MGRVALLALLLLAGCPGPLEPRLSVLQEQVFTPSCTFSSCHSAARAAGGLVLTQGQARDQLLRAALQERAAAEGLLRVKPGDPGASFLLRKLDPGLESTYGDPMPRTGGTLDQRERDAIRAWIAAGAQDD